MTYPQQHIEQEVLRERLTHMSQTTLPDILGHFVALPILYYFLQQSAPHSPFDIWLELVYASFFIRLPMYFLIQKKYIRPSLKSWTYILNILSIISALGWGSLVFFIPDDPTYSLLVSAIFFGCIGGALGATGHIFPVFTTFAAPIGILLSIHFAMHNNILFHTMALITMTYLFITIYISHQFTEVSYKKAILDKENQQLIEQLTQEKQIAEKANHDKSRFLASANHDLRQPLQAMSLFIEALQQKNKDPELQVLTQKIQRSMNDMNNLLSSLLDMSRLDAGLVRVEQHKFQLFPMLKKLEQQFTPQNHKPIDLLIDTQITTRKGTRVPTQASDIIIRSDPILFENIVRNLLSNAFKYTEQGSIHVHCIEGNEQHTLVIEDTGIGIAEEEQKKIFDAFYQIGNTSRDRSKGIGLGLSIVQHLCQLLEHPLHIHSTLKQGTRLEIQVPAAQTANLPPAPTTIPTQFDITILVVDDDINILEGMQAMMEPWGCHVIVAKSLQEVAKILHNQHHIDLILMDYRLQDDCVGTDVIQEIQHILNNPNIPSLLISGDTNPNYLKKIQATGIPTLNKPIKPMQLRSMIRYLLSQKEDH